MFWVLVRYSGGIFVFAIPTVVSMGRAQKGLAFGKPDHTLLPS